MFRMNYLTGAVMGVTLCALMAANANAQEYSVYEPVVGAPAHQAGAVMPVNALMAAPGCAAPGCADAGCATPGCATPGCATPSCCAPGCCQPCCQPCCGRSCGLLDACPLDCCDSDPWTLFPGDNCRGWFANGWINAGFYGNNHGNSRPGGNGPIPFNTAGNRGQLNQAWINLGKSMVFDDRSFDWGWNADVVYGTDALATNSFGDGGWDARGPWATSSRYGTAIPQLYVEAGTETLSVKVGHFYTIIGYEVVQAPGNFFYSHAYTMNFGEPFTHTGALATWTPNEDLTVWGGYVWGWDSGFENGLEAHTFLGGFSMPVGDRSTFTYAMNVGQFGDGTGVGGAPGLSSGDIYMHSVVLDTQLNDRMNWVLQSDYGTNQNVPGGANSDWYGANTYLFYDLTCNLRAGLRAEWFADPNGARVGNGNGDYLAFTGGFNYTMTDNFTLRPEVRYDTFKAYANNPGRAFNPNTAGVNQDGAQWSYGIDGIWTF